MEAKQKDVHEKEIIYIRGKKIEEYIEWNLNINDGKIRFKIVYPSGKPYSCPYDECEILPKEEMDADLLYNKKKNAFSAVDSVTKVGYKYYIVTYSKGEKPFLMIQSEVKLGKANKSTSQDAYVYFKQVAQERVGQALSEKEKVIAENVVNQFEQIVAHDETALSAYIFQKILLRDEITDYIYPFGVNETQMEAVKKAFQSQLSIIEGPPGTGKTQTILNIIANIVVNGKNCAIVSNNNEAVINVYDKLKERKLDFLIAKLGKNKNREIFFDNFSYKIPSFELTKISMNDIKILTNKIEVYLSSKNKLAQLQSEIQEIEIERAYLNEWYSQHPDLEINYIKKYKISYTKYIELSAYLRSIQGNALSFRDKWTLLSQYKVFKSSFLKNVDNRENFIFSLQYTFYEELLKEKNEERNTLERTLSEIKFDENLKKLTEDSMSYLYNYIYYHIPDEMPDFTYDSYKKEFGRFLSYYPAIGSSTHSLVSSITQGCLLDYVIIDEASQQDLVPGVLCFGCAKNVIIVGDRKQLPHIPVGSKIVPPDELYDCTKFSLLDSVSEIFGDSIPRTLLKEHYRCHPKIIQFCNKQFYNGELIPMKPDNGEDALSLIVTAAGNHMRNYSNQREIESILAVHDACSCFSEIETQGGKTVGVIAPYNKQVQLADEMMPSDIINKTIHKFQGRECDKIYFSTVLDKKKKYQQQIDFVDNAALINVAVSRAKDKFTLVTGKDVFLENNKYIAALVRYIKYYGEEDSVIDSPVISAFDLLYSEYDRSLERLAKKLNPKDSKYKSEQIMAAVLREILSNEEFKTIEFHMQIYLKQLVLCENIMFTEQEKSYIKNRASCDFVLYYKVGKTPFAVIEVDGEYHEYAEQRRRDELKNSILEKAQLKLLRMKTVTGNVEDTVMNFIRNCM